MSKTVFRTLLLLVLSVNAPTPLFAEEHDPYAPLILADQLYDLADEHDFIIKGVVKVGDTGLRRTRGDDLEVIIEQLLAGFNFMLSRDENEQIERLVILHKIVRKPDKIILETQKKGHQHIVEASIKGLSNDWVKVKLTVDTGADRVVLPASLMEPLGYDSEQMEDSILQTVNGKVEAKIVYLEAVEIGGEIINNVSTAFVEDELLGNVMLLGMNVLSQYQITLDDKLNQFTLIKKQQE